MLSAARVCMAPDRAVHQTCQDDSHRSGLRNSVRVRAEGQLHAQQVRKPTLVSEQEGQITRFEPSRWAHTNFLCSSAPLIKERASSADVMSLSAAPSTRTPKLRSQGNWVTGTGETHARKHFQASRL
eukprot:2210425-Rhodomonas_salina.1